MSVDDLCSRNSAFPQSNSRDYEGIRCFAVTTSIKIWQRVASLTSTELSTFLYVDIPIKA
jgi:hypothetical protein